MQFSALLACSTAIGVSVGTLVSCVTKDSTSIGKTVICSAFRPMKWSKEDTQESQEQILVHNKVWDHFCLK